MKTTKGYNNNGRYRALTNDQIRPIFQNKPRMRSSKRGFYKDENENTEYDDEEDDDGDYDVLIPRKLVDRMIMTDRIWPFLNPKMFNERRFGKMSSFKEDPEEVIVDSGSASAKIADELEPYSPLAPMMVQPRRVNVAHSANTYAEPILVQNENSGPIPPSSNTYVQSQPYQGFSSDTYSYVSQYPPDSYYSDSQTLQQQYVQPTPESAPTSLSYYPSYSYPTYKTGLNGIFNRMQCFSGDMEVETPTGFKAIKDLKIGDMVLSIDESMVTFSPIVMFLHKVKHEQAEFNLLEMDSGYSLKLTDHHLLYITSCGYNEPMKIIPAMEVVIGDCVYVTKEGNGLEKHTIVKISKVLDVGIYAPLTSTGDIFVNRVLSSCHSNLGLKTLQQTFFIAYSRFSNILKRFFPKSNNGEENLPYGLPYLTTVIDIFLPKSVI